MAAQAYPLIDLIDRCEVHTRPVAFDQVVGLGVEEPRHDQETARREEVAQRIDELSQRAGKNIGDHQVAAAGPGSGVVAVRQG